MTPFSHFLPFQPLPRRPPGRDKQAPVTGPAEYPGSGALLDPSWAVDGLVSIPWGLWYPLNLCPQQVSTRVKPLRESGIKCCHRDAGPHLSPFKM